MGARPHLRRPAAACRAIPTTPIESPRNDRPSLNQQRQPWGEDQVALEPSDLAGETGAL